MNRLPSPSMIVALVALAVALGGTSYAAVSLPRNSVGTKQLKRNAVTSPKVKNRSLRAVDFRAGELPVGERGPTGPTGPRGPAGLRGPARSPDTSNFFTKSQSDARFLGATETAANAGQLQGIGANGFVQGSRYWTSLVVAAGETQDVGVSSLGSIRLACSDPASDGTVRWAGVAATSVFTDDGAGGVTQQSLTGGSTLGTPVTVNPTKHVTWLVAGGTDLDHVEAFVRAGPDGANSCIAFVRADKNRPGS